MQETILEGRNAQKYLQQATTIVFGTLKFGGAYLR